jgi:rRNA 2'-O-methyltransferase fibrillarin
MAKKRTNIVPLVMDARKPWDYRFFVEMVDFVFADVAQPDQARIMGINCRHFLKNGGHFMIAIKVSPFPRSILTPLGLMCRLHR